MAQQFASQKSHFPPSKAASILLGPRLAAAGPTAAVWVVAQMSGRRQSQKRRRRRRECKEGRKKDRPNGRRKEGGKGRRVPPRSPQPAYPASPIPSVCPSSTLRHGCQMLLTLPPFSQPQSQPICGPSRPCCWPSTNTGLFGLDLDYFSLPIPPSFP
jgi:hypothetical protein